MRSTWIIITALFSSVLAAGLIVVAGIYLLATSEGLKDTTKTADRAAAQVETAANRIDTLSDVYLPVVSDMGYSREWRDDTYLYLEVYGAKTRRCSAPKKIVALSMSDFRVTYTVDFMRDLQSDGTFKEPSEKPVTPEGQIVSFGVWRLKPIPKGNYWFQVTHNCGGNLVTTNFTLLDYRNRYIPVSQ